jgi:hypothetical protein
LVVNVIVIVNVNGTETVTANVNETGEGTAGTKTEIRGKGSPGGSENMAVAWIRMSDEKTEERTNAVDSCICSNE